MFTNQCLIKVLWKHYYSLGSISWVANVFLVNGATVTHESHEHWFPTENNDSTVFNEKKYSIIIFCVAPC